MARNITSSIKKVVEKIQAVVNTQEKYTIDGDETCKDWLKSLNIDKTLRLFPNFYSDWLTYENDNYLVLVNHKFKYQIPCFLQEENLNSGAWVAIVDGLELPVTGDTDILQEILESDWEINQQGFKQVQFDTVVGNFSLKDCFPTISLYKIIDRFTQKEKLEQITGIALTESESYCLLPYSAEVLQEFTDTFETGNQYIPFENILASYVASDFKFAYLDLYRCIEGLQPLYFLKDFYDKLALNNKSVQDFYIDFYETTKLEPKLEDSLKKLLESIKINYKYADKQHYSPSLYLYKLRNQIVHLRPKQTNDLIPKSIADWNFLMLDMLTIVQELYKTNQNLLT
ncbi:hypothetical protein [Anabaena sp. UHCC 0451]|uniref:hypothetical protein n=1 Tax=Anabaena sp. UHCC 0451 TaxID=2055235 RepID=UPI002B1FF635|nr:hypothetical protein [Anabaena sp. UHCC 0451]MEA5576156.1 hypothetical protein [Anabaena sp. UHCC 0451]